MAFAVAMGSAQQPGHASFLFGAPQDQTHSGLLDKRKLEDDGNYPRGPMRSQKQT
jgi:hypothetical protein